MEQEQEHGILDLREEESNEEILPKSNMNEFSYMDLEMDLKMDLSKFNLNLGF